MGSEPSYGDFSPLERTNNRVKLILSVDDEPAILFTRQQILESAGYDVLSAADGERALQIFAALPVDLVLLDYMMPGIDGGVVSRVMKAKKPNIPVIIVSASPVAKEHLVWSDCWLDKGQGPGVLLEKIEQFLWGSLKKPSADALSKRTLP